MSTANYRPLHGLPALAGLCTFEEAQRPGLSVEECVRRLKRYHYAFKRLHEIFIARLTSEPIYELKMAFSLHAHLCAEHVAALRQRVGEMREPPLGLESAPDENLAIFFDEILCAPTTGELLGGIYESVIPSLISALEKHRAETNPLADAPTLRVVKFGLLELAEMREYGARALGALRSMFDVRRSTFDVQPAAGAVVTEQASHESEGRCAEPNVERRTLNVEHRSGFDLLAPQRTIRRCSATPFTYDGIPRRDSRFPDPYNMGVNAEAFLYDPTMPPEPKVPMMFYKRLREIDVPEMMASIITETKGKPWGYYRDMTRQLWDEARHAMMGEVGFVSLGINWPECVMINHTWSLGLNTQLTARERHGVLYFIEQGLMPKTGKRFEWETACASHHALAATIQDYDWADEVLHARVGRDWYVSQFENPKEAVEWGDRAWSKVLVGWTQWRDEGLTEHRNWWPQVYGEFCRAERTEPDPRVAAFAETYEQKRADLKLVSASG